MSAGGHLRLIGMMGAGESLVAEVADLVVEPWNAS